MTELTNSGATDRSGVETRSVRLRGPLDARIRPPGSKSITNRALVCAALADGRTLLRGALESGFGVLLF